MTAPWNGRPPAPLDERDGWHWLHMADGRSVPRLWMGPLNFWARSGNEACMCPTDAVDCGSKYGGPMLLPDQIAAQIAEAVKAEREACMALVKELVIPPVPPDDPAAEAELINGALQEAYDAIRSRGETA